MKDYTGYRIGGYCTIRSKTPCSRRSHINSPIPLTKRPNKIKTLLYFLLLTITLLSCQVKTEGTKPEITEIQVDTLVIDYDIENSKKEQMDLSFRDLEVADLIDTLNSRSEYSGIRDITESGLPFTIENNSKFHSNNISHRIYSLIFPEDEIELDKTRFSNKITKTNDSLVTIQKGLRIIETRKYKTLLSVVEKDNYLQLLFTKQGKYSPDVDLITVSKQDIRKIDAITLNGGIYDSYDIDYRHSEFDNSHEGFVLTHVMNTKSDEVKLDTIYTAYSISDSGVIKER